MAEAKLPPRAPGQEHSVPWFWPFAALGCKLDLKTIRVPLYLLAGEQDDITTKEQAFNAASLVGTPARDIEKKLVPGGRIGLFMGTRTLAETWPEIGRWISARG